MTDIVMPRLSDTMLEGTIARWLKKPGDAINRGDVLAQIETDKATMDLEAFDSGTLEEVVAAEGSTIPIGEVVARISPGGAAAGAQPAGPPTAEKTAAEKPSRPQPEAPPEPPAAEAGPERPARQAGDGAVPEKVKASPLARRMAEEHGLDLASLAGTGPEGRVIRADVESALAEKGAPPAEAPSPPAPAPPAAEAEPERVPLNAMRRTIARRMAESTRTIPHFYLTVGVDATELVQLRQQLNRQMEAAGQDIKISLNDLVIKAVALALRKVPEVNVSFAEDTLLRHNRVNVGIAVAVENGLIVPVLRDADRKSLSQIGREARELAERARAGKLQPPEYTGGTFTISNLGMFGVEQFNAVINPPEAAILAVGSVQREPTEDQGQVVFRERMKLTMSIDHRALDGATGARYLQSLRELLEQPLVLLV